MTDPMDNSYIVIDQSDRKLSNIESGLNDLEVRVNVICSDIKSLQKELNKFNCAFHEQIRELNREMDEVQKKINLTTKNLSFKHPSWIDMNRLSIADAEKITYERRRNNAIRQNIGAKFLPDKSC